MLYIVSTSYDSELNSVILKLYNDETKKIEEWTDNKFRAYFLAEHEVDKKNIKIVKKEIVTKYNALIGKDVNLHKMYLETPFEMNQVKKLSQYWNEQEYPPNKIYEHHVDFFQSYIYDNDVKMGMPHKRENGKLVFQIDQNAEERIKEILGRFQNLTLEEREVFEKWMQLLEYPAPSFKRASLDIEVLGEAKNQFPNTDNATLPIIAACLASNTGERIALVLIQENKLFDKIPDNVTKIMFFTEEKAMLLALFKEMNKYPFLLTFNGDNFDLRYIYNRALRFGFLKEQIPIILRRKISLLEKSVHIDLYKFFNIKAMRVYAFKAKYKSVDLNSVAKALIKKEKIDTGTWINDLNYHDLIRYCMHDAIITLELTTYNNNLVMNLILMLQRMSRMPVENVSRQSVARWIKSFLIYEHRQRNILIPKPADIRTIKGQTKSEAMIKGKKYKGAIVFKPIEGVHFNVTCVDFASLYPSIIKVYNLGYSTINCSHEECKTNTVGELPHWICTKKRALESLLIGAIRDLRVYHYKKEAKNKTLNIMLMNWYSVAEQSIKVIMNATYGVLGAESFDFYCPPVAEEITAIARYIISKTAEKAIEMGMEVLYGDTDSIFIKDPPKDKLKALIEWTFNTYGIEFEVDKLFRYMCLSSRKKNYFGVDMNGEVEVKGLTGKKKHTPLIIKNVFNETKKILSTIKTPEEMKVGKIKIVQLIKDIHKIFKYRQWNNMEELAFHVTIIKELNEYTKNIPQHVKAANMLIAEGYSVESGLNVGFIKTRKRVKTKKGFKWEKDVKPIQLAQKSDVDVDKYIEFLKSTFKQILDPMDINFDEEILGIAMLDRWQH